MDNDDRRFPWLNAWLIVFGGLGIWAFVRQLQGSYADLNYVLVGILIPAGIALVGILRLPNLQRTVERHTLDDLGRIYMESFRTLRRHWWIFALFAAIGLVHVIGGAADSAFYSTIRQESNRGRDASDVAVPLSIRIADTAARAYPDGMRRAIRWLMPSYGAASRGAAFVIVAVLFFIGVVWFGRKLKRMASHEQNPEGARFARTILLPVAIATLGTAAVTAKMMVMALVTYFREAATPGGNPALRVSQEIAATFGGKRQLLGQTLFSWEVDIFFAVLTALIIAGLTGALLRMQRNEPVTQKAFLSDMTRFLKPVLGVYLVLALVRTVLMLPYWIPWQPLHTAQMVLWGIWTLVALLFVLAPYAVVRFNLGALDGMRRSAKDLRQNAWDSVSFAVLGLSFAGPLLVIYYGVAHWLRDDSGLRMWRLAGETTSYHLLAAVAAPVMAIALWGFYCLIVPFDQAERPMTDG